MTPTQADTKEASKPEITTEPCPECSSTRTWCINPVEVDELDGEPTMKCDSCQNVW